MSSLGKAVDVAISVPEKTLDLGKSRKIQEMFGQKKEESEEKIWKRRIFFKKLVITIILTFFMLGMLAGQSLQATVKFPLFAIYAVCAILYWIKG